MLAGGLWEETNLAENRGGGAIGYEFNKARPKNPPRYLLTNNIDDKTATKYL
jgi:hypothetical protein